MKIGDFLDKAVQGNLTPTKLCKLAQLMTDPQWFDDTDRKKLTDVLETPVGARGRLSNSEIYRVLMAAGVDISLSVIDRHRNKECVCYRSALVRR